MNLAPRHPRVEFWSATRYDAFLPPLARELTQRGFPTTVETAVADRMYRQARFWPERWRWRWRAYVQFPRRLRSRLGRVSEPCVVVVATNPFFAPRWAVRAAPLARSDVAVVNWVLDLYPEAWVAAGWLAAEGGWARRWRRCAQQVYREAAANVFLGESLRACAEEAAGPIPRSWVIPVGAACAQFGERRWSEGIAETHRPVRVLYCGNLGRMHDTATLLAMSRAGLPAGVEVEVRAHGKGFRELARRVDPAPRLRLGPPLEGTAWPVAMGEADVALVTIRPGAERVVMPSKTYAALAAGQAVIAVCPERSELRATVQRHDCGWWVRPGDDAGLRAALAEAARDRVALRRRQENALRAARETYDVGVVAARWSDLLAKLEEERAW